MGAEKLSFHIDDTNQGYALIHFDGDLSFATCKEFESVVEQFSSKDLHVLIDCANVYTIPKDFLRSLVKLNSHLKEKEKSLKLYNVGTTLMCNLKIEGMDSSFRIAKDIKSALSDTNLTAPRKTLDTEFINPFLMATIHVLKVQALVESKAGKVYMKNASDPCIGDISGVIGIVSDSFKGSVVVSFPEMTFLKIMSSMLGEEFTKVDREILDGAGELTNMIFGQAKIVLNEKGLGIKTAIPSVVSGKDHSLSSFTKGSVIVVPFESDAGKFFVEICLSS